MRPNTTRKPLRRKKNLLAVEGIEVVDWKDVPLLRKFISDRGKIRSRRVTGLTVQQQKQVATAIKNAREMALLPYPGPASR
ncbi:SSU ribosomal protein S18P [Herbihabitans rhizosphaerae]|uniref:Small ribosomal subunit protein bS18 n=1 Tax=Herbihabitans rhizosphaerae TaxID=1872711 RepID=A0A4Q7L8G6_9PSEU|nr:30S ribosomal protein S18 [Herbihabitans rhizosphaerae]RZS44692.1 SSU ribosomal protein S18P [Herbihabitans rhizosphaerae]